MSETRITAEKARDVVYARKDVFDRTLNIIRNMVDTKVLEEAQRGGYSATISVPKSVFGREPYDYVVMGKALAEQLYGDGFTVTGTFTRMAVSWGGKESLSKKSSKKSSSSPPKRQGIVIPIPKNMNYSHRPK